MRAVSLLGRLSFVGSCALAAGLLLNSFSQAGELFFPRAQLNPAAPAYIFPDKAAPNVVFVAGNYGATLTQLPGGVLYEWPTGQSQLGIQRFDPVLGLPGDFPLFITGSTTPVAKIVSDGGVFFWSNTVQGLHKFQTQFYTTEFSAFEKNLKRYEEEKGDKDLTAKIDKLTALLKKEQAAEKKKDGKDADAKTEEVKEDASSEVKEEAAPETDGLDAFIEQNAK